MRQGREMASGSIQAPLCPISEAKTYLFLIPFAAKVRSGGGGDDGGAVDDATLVAVAPPGAVEAAASPGRARGGCGGTRKGLPAPVRSSSSVTVQLSGFKSHCLTVLPGRNTTLPPSSIAYSSVVSVFEASTAATGPRPCIDPAVSHTRIHSRAGCRRRAAPSVLNPENLVQAGRAVMSESRR